jgi:hypothetical protein
MSLKSRREKQKNQSHTAEKKVIGEMGSVKKT